MKRKGKITQKTKNKAKGKARRQKYIPGKKRFLDYRIQPGQVLNPNGRPKGAYSIYKDLEKAIKIVEKEKKINVLKHFVERALVSDKVLVALLKKLIPDRQFVENEGELAKVVNIVYGYRKRSGISDSSVRDGQEGAGVSSEPNPTEGS